MTIRASEVRKLKKLARLANVLLENSVPAGAELHGRPLGNKRRRRSGRELIAFRKTLEAERKKGMRVAEIAEKYGVSSAYVYQIR